MSGIFPDLSGVIGQIGSAFQSLAPAPAPQQGFAPGQGVGGAFAPAPAVGGPATWPTVTLGAQGFQPAQLNPGTFNPSGSFGGGFQPANLATSVFGPSPGMSAGSIFAPSAQNPLVAPTKQTNGSSSGTGSTSGTTATYTGLEPKVAAWAPQIQQTFGDLAPWLPDAMLAIVTNESHGDPNAYNAAGNAYGLFQQVGLNSSDPTTEFAGARKLAQEKLANIATAYAANGLNPDERTRALDFALAWAGHFNYKTGTMDPNSVDYLVGGQTSQQFANVFLNNYDNVIKGKQAASGASTPAGPALQTIFGGTVPPVMQEFGNTDYSQGHPDTYAYGNAYGLVGSQHPGVDYGMPSGSKLYVPLGGTVSVVGNDGTGYYYSNPGNPDPNHSGELMITLANGDQIIMGHMSSIGLQVGQQVQAGQFAGLSGGSDGDHLHLEVRVKDPSLPSGYRIIDPRTYFGQR